MIAPLSRSPWTATLPAWLAGLVLGFWLATCAATSVRAVSLQEMLAQAELIFEGEVIRVEVQETPGYRRPFTRITLKVLDIIKGSWKHPTIILDFLGGEAGSKRLAVTDMEYPALGEHGIYFVESLSRRQVHPLYGWSQGRFVIYADASGQLRIQTASGLPVTRLEFAPAADPSRISRGIAKGVVIRRDALANEALSLEDFKQQLRLHLNEIHQ